MNKGEVLKIVDKCFRSYASSYRHDAKELAEKLIDDLENNQGQELPIVGVIICSRVGCGNVKDKNSNSYCLECSYERTMSGY